MCAVASAFRAHAVRVWSCAGAVRVAFLATMLSPFSRSFTLSSADGKLWIAPLTNATARTPLIIKGANWLGFQKDGDA